MVPSFSVFLEDVRIHNTVYPYAVRAVQIGFPVDDFCEWYLSESSLWSSLEDWPSFGNWVSQKWHGRSAGKQAMVSAQTALANLAKTIITNPGDFEDGGRNLNVQLKKLQDVLDREMNPSYTDEPYSTTRPAIPKMDPEARKAAIERRRHYAANAAERELYKNKNYNPATKGNVSYLRPAKKSIEDVGKLPVYRKLRPKDEP